MGKTGMIILGLIIAFFVAVTIFSNTTNSPKGHTAWNDQMVTGSPDAKNTMVEYTDITCPHCADFHNAATGGSFDEDYIKSGKVRFEIRVTSMLQGKSLNSERAGESAYCAADQGKFFEYYDGIVARFTKDYFDKGVGVSVTSADIPKLDDSYYTSTAGEKGLDVARFEACLSAGEMKSKLAEATNKAAQLLPYGSGVPYFIVNKFTSSGFGGDYRAIQQMMRAGGVE